MTVFKGLASPAGKSGMSRFHPTPRFTLAALNAGSAQHSGRSDARGSTLQIYYYYRADLNAARSGDRAYCLVQRCRQRSELAGALVPSK